MIRTSAAILIQRGADPDIFIACALGDVEIAKTVLSTDPDCLDARIGKGQFTSGESDGGHIYLYKLSYTARPLPLAADRSHSALVDFLLDHASPKQRFLLSCWRAEPVHDPDVLRSLSHDEMELLADAAWENKPDAVRVMLQAGFDPHVQSVHRSTPLDRAAFMGFAGVVQVLLELDPNPPLEVRNEFGGTPLSACIYGSSHCGRRRGDHARTAELLIAAARKCPKN